MSLFQKVGRHGDCDLDFNHQTHQVQLNSWLVSKGGMDAASTPVHICKVHRSHCGHPSSSICDVTMHSSKLRPHPTQNRSPGIFEYLVHSMCFLYDVFCL